MEMNITELKDRSYIGMPSKFKGSIDRHILTKNVRIKPKIPERLSWKRMRRNYGARVCRCENE